MSAIVVLGHAGLGGSGVVAEELARHLAQRGRRVHWVSPELESIADERAPIPNLSVRRVRAADHPVFAGSPPLAIAIAAANEDIARSEPVAAISAHYALPHAVSALLARASLGERGPMIVTTLHGTDVTGIGLDPSYRAIVRHAVLSSDAITAPSVFLADRARAALETTREVHVIPNFVDTARFRPGPKSPEPLLFHVSNLRPVKRAVDLIEVLAAVRAAGIGARLAIVGEGPDRARAAIRADELGVSSAIEWLGATRDFAARMSAADLFLSTSESESFGLAALEAMSAGVPVFGYRVGGLAEVVGEIGALVDPLDVGALSRAVIAALGDRPALAALGSRARARAVERFRPEAALDAYEALFDRRTP